MTREEYIDELKGQLQSLTIEEQNEAVQYYEDYFNEAGNDEKVIEELGSPEELAKSIVEKCANALSKKSEIENENNSSYQNTNSNSMALYYEFEQSKVTNLTLKFSAAEVIAIKGNKFAVETRGMSKNDLNCNLGVDGTLTISNDKKINLNFWNHDRSKRFVPRILVSIPEDAHVDKLKFMIDAGRFEAKNISVYFNDARLEVGAGNLVLSRLFGGKINLRCGMGNLDFTGSATNGNIDCGMGSVKLNIKGNKNDYSYDAKVGLGDVKINGEKKSGFYQTAIDSVKKENHFSVNCGMGSVNINIEQE